MAKVGRPSKYSEAYCEQVIKLGKKGMSVVEMACALGVHRETIEENWPKAYPAFSEAFARAKLESQAWWERTGREGMCAKSIDAAIYSRSMAARFPKDWRESKLIGSDPENPLPVGFDVRLIGGPDDAP